MLDIPEINGPMPFIRGFSNRPIQTTPTPPRASPCSCRLLRRAALNCRGVMLSSPFISDLATPTRAIINDCDAWHSSLLRTAPLALASSCKSEACRLTLAEVISFCSTMQFFSALSILCLSSSTLVSHMTSLLPTRRFYSTSYTTIGLSSDK